MAKNTPFSDITVLDFSRYLPGGYATQVLADLGATVIKVEDTGLGDFMRHDGSLTVPDTVVTVVGEHNTTFMVFS